MYASKTFRVWMTGFMAMAVTTALWAAPGQASADVLTFGFTGEEQSFVVPAGVSSIAIEATGAPGARGQDFSFPGPGGVRGLGARARNVLAVNPGQVLYVNVGGPGPAGGFNGGAPGGGGNVFQGGDGGHGGGATDLRTCATGAPLCPGGGDTLGSRLVVAGGGGGGGGGNGGQPAAAGIGGSGAAGGTSLGGDGTAGESFPFSGLGGQGGQDASAGTGGEGRNGQQPGADGSGPDGGPGGGNNGNSGGGGGAGGGWFGGGGGGSGFGGGGGGAGSSHGPTGTTFATDATGTPSLVVYMAEPTVGTGPAQGTTQNSTELTGTVNPQGQETSWHFEYGTDTSYGQSAPLVPGDAGDGLSGVPVSTVISDLEPGTTYHFRLVATNAIGTSAGTDRTFTTAPEPDPPAVEPPVVITGGASGVSETGVELNGSVNPRGEETTWSFEYGRTTGEVTAVPVTPVSAGSGGIAVPVVADLSGLEAGTTYQYRLVAENVAGQSEDDFRSFTTRVAPAPPVAEADLRVRIDIQTHRPRKGSRLDFRITLSNRGPGPAPSGVIRATLPGKVQFRSASGGCGGNGARVTCRLASALATGKSRSVTIRTRAVRAGKLRIKASASSAVPDPGGARASAGSRIRR